MFIGVTLALQVLGGCASLEARLHQRTLAIREHQEPITAVVLRTFGDVSKKQDLIDYYAAQMENSGFKLSVLHDAGNAATASQEQVRVDASGGVASKTRLVKSGGFDFTVRLRSMPSTSKTIARAEVPVCIVSWSKAEEDYGKATMDRVASLGSHSAHDQYLSLWYRHCDPLQAGFTWFLEDDVRFSGQVVNFFMSFQNEDSDLLSSGLRIAGPGWWKYNTLSDWFLSHTTNFSQSTKVIKNLDWLPSLMGEEPMHESSGVLFFQDHVMRVTDKLLKGIDRCFDLGVPGPSESFIAQICGSQLYISGSSPCTILDFAPVATRDQPNQWVSKYWSWDSVFESSGKSSVCTPDNQNKWFHKCQSNPEDFDCQQSLYMSDLPSHSSHGMTDK